MLVRLQRVWWVRVLCLLCVIGAVGVSLWLAPEWRGRVEAQGREGVVSVQLSSVGMGIVTCAPDGEGEDPGRPCTFDAGTVVRLTPAANPGWAFLRWAGDVSGTQSPLWVRVEADAAITAVFVRCDGLFWEFAQCRDTLASYEGEARSVPELRREEGEGLAGLTSITCEFPLTGSAMTPPGASTALGQAGLRFYPTTGDVALYVEHTVQAPLRAWVGAETQNEPSEWIIDLGDGLNPILHFFTIAEIERLQEEEAYFVQINSRAYPRGDVRGVLHCQPEQTTYIRKEGEGDGTGIGGLSVKHLVEDAFNLAGPLPSMAKSGNEGSGDGEEEDLGCDGALAMVCPIPLMAVPEGSQESGSGQLRAVVDRYSSPISMSMRFTHNVSNPTGAYLKRTSDGTVFINFGNGVSPVSYEFSSSEITTMLSGEFYAEVTSVAYPDGAIRGVPNFESGQVELTGPIYVDQTNSSSIQNGLCWETALPEIQPAIDFAAQLGGGDVWVAQGRYGLTANNTEALSVAVLQSNVAVYGGFDGTETELAQRDFDSQPTVLEGGVSPVEDVSAQHVVQGTGLSDARLDGFVIMGGDAQQQGGADCGGGIYLSDANETVFLENLTVYANSALSGGGICLENANPQVNNVRMLSNISSQGGALYAEGSSPTISNTLVAGNVAWEYFSQGKGQGAAFYMDSDSSALLENATIAGNWSRDGGALYIEGQNTGVLPVSMVNTLMWYNRGGDVFGDVDAQYSLLNGNCTNTSCLQASPRLWASAASEFTANAVFDPQTNDATLYDTTQNFAPNALAGKIVEIEFGSVWLPGFRLCLLVKSNTATSFVVLGNLGSAGQAGVRYRFVNYTPMAGSSVIDAGTSTGVPIADLNGISRGFDGDHQGTGNTGDGSDYDIGAVEYTGTGQETITVSILDAGLESVLETALNTQAPFTLNDLLGLTALTAENAEINDLRGLEYCANLTELHLSHNAIQDITPLSYLGKLQHLDLSYNQITDCSALSGLTSLAYLNLRQNQLTRVDCLQDLTALMHLDLSMNRIMDVGPLSGLTALTYLDLGIGNWIGEDPYVDFYAANANAFTSISALSALTALTYLNVAGNPGLTNLSPLGGLTQLQQLWIGGASISDFSPLAGLDNLGVLSIIRADLTDAAMPYIADKTGLMVLFLINNPDLSDISSLSGFDLAAFWLSGTQVDDIAVCANWGNLEFAYIADSPIDSLESISDLIGLTDLHVENTRVDDLTPLTDLVNLEVLAITGNPVTDLTGLEGLESLFEIDLHSNQISEIQPLLDNPSIGGSDVVNICANPLTQSAVCDDLPVLAARFSAPGELQYDQWCGPQARLTVHVTGVGNVSPNAGVHVFHPGETVWLSASPMQDSSYAFSHWQGDLAQTPTTEPVISMVMNGDKTVEAVFVSTGQTFHTLTLLQRGDGQGDLSPSSGSYTYIAGRSVSISAMPRPRSGFGGWTGAVTSMRKNETILMDGAKTVTANFIKGGTRLNVTVQGNGATNPAAGTHYYTWGSQVPLDAFESDPMWYFDHWQGSFQSTSPNTFITLNSEKSVTAVFQPDFTLTLNVTGQGTTAPLLAPGTYHFNKNEHPGLFALPDAGWYFVRWEMNGQPYNSYDYTELIIDADKTLTAVFEPMIPLSVSIEGQGGVAVSRNGTLFRGFYWFIPGATATLTVQNTHPAWYLDRWEGAVNSSAHTVTIVMNSAQSVTAVFERMFGLQQEESFESGDSAISMDGLWHVSDTCSVSLPGHGGSHALYYGQDSTCNYDLGNTSGFAVLPEIDLRTVAGSAYLSFTYFLETERAAESFDIATVEVSVNGGAYQLLASNNPETAPTLLADPSYTWRHVAFDLSEYFGKIIQFRLGFDTVDSWVNQYAGFYVDDVAVYVESSETGYIDLDNSLALLCSFLNPSVVCDDPVDLNGDEPFTANGMPDAYEFALIEELIAHPERCPSAPETLCGVAETWYANLHAIRHAMGDNHALKLAPALAAYLTLGDEDSFALVSAIMVQLGMGPLNPDMFDLHQKPVLSPEGDADGDGHLNREEWGFQACSGTPATDRTRYIDAALTGTMNLAQAAAGLTPGEAIPEYFADRNGASVPWQDDFLDMEFSPNQIPEGMEFYLLQTACNADCLHALSHNGIEPNTPALTVWEYNLGQVEDLLETAPPSASNTFLDYDVTPAAIAAYITLGDDASFSTADAFARHFLGLSELNPGLFDRSLAGYLGADGDADGDGYTNQIEARAMLDASPNNPIPAQLAQEISGYTTETARLQAYGRQYVAQALDPEKKPFALLDFEEGWSVLGDFGNASDVNGLDGGGNGIPDLAECLLLQTVLKTPFIDFSASDGVSTQAVADRWLDIREAFLPGSEYNSEAASLFDAYTAYAALGDSWSLAIARTALLSSHWYRLVSETVLSADDYGPLAAWGDADGDGFSNLFEWKAIQKTGNVIFDAATYSAAALDPTTQYTNYHHLTCTAQGQGTVTAYPTLDKYYHEMPVRLVANPGANMALRRWEGALTGTQNPATITMNEDKTVTAVFGEINLLTVVCSPNVSSNRVDVSLNGVLQTPQNGVYTVLQGDVLQLTPVPATRFLNWSGVISGSQSPATLTMNGSTTVTAVFKPEYNLTLNILNAPSAGAVSVNGTAQSAQTATYTFLENQQVTLDIASAAVSEFKEWQGDTTGSQTSLTFNMTGDKTITAAFYKYAQLSVQTIGEGGVSATRNGTTLALPCTIREDQSVVLTATADTGYQFKRWEGSVEELDNPLTLTNMVEDSTITCVFRAENNLTVNIVRDELKAPLSAVSVGRNGDPNPQTITEASTTFDFMEQDAVELKALFRQIGYETEYDFLGWYTGQGVNTVSLGPDPELSFTLEGDRNITAEFSAYDTYVPGCPLQFNIRLHYAGVETINATGVMIEIPVGWSFVSCTPAPYAMPDGESTGELEFALNPQIAFPQTLSVSLNVPATDSGTKQIRYHAQFRTSGAAMMTGTRTKTLLQADTCPPTPVYTHLTLSDETQNLNEFRAFAVSDGNGAPVHQPTSACGYDRPHSADQDGNWCIDFSELLRVIQFFNLGGYHVDPCGQSEDGYLPYIPASYARSLGYAHDSDFYPADWRITLTELLRLVQFYNLRGYQPCTRARGCTTIAEDGYTAGKCEDCVFPNFSFAREFIPGNDPATKTFEVTFNDPLPNNLAFLTLTETMPCGWSFNTESLQPAPTLPDSPMPVYNVENNNMKFEWGFFGSPPNSLKFRYSVSASDGYQKIVTGKASYMFTNLCSIATKPVNTCFTYGFPEICLDPKEIIVECGSNFFPPSCTATDVEDGDLTASVVITGAVDASAPGTYFLNYDVSDLNNNAAPTVTCVVTVVDLPPVITLNPQIPSASNTDVVLECGDTYVEPGYSAVSDCGLDISSNVIVDLPEMAVPGDYSISYTVQNSRGISTTVSRNVQVVHTAPPVITLIGPDIVRVDADKVFVDPGYTVSDQCTNESVQVSIFLEKIKSTDIEYIHSESQQYPYQFFVQYYAKDLKGNILVGPRRKALFADDWDVAVFSKGDAVYSMFFTALANSYMITQGPNNWLKNNDQIKGYHLASLKKIELTGKEMNDCLGALKYCAYLEVLNLCGNAITDVEFANMPDLPRLREIYLNGNQLSSLDRLENDEALEVVIAAGYAVYERNGLRTNAIKDIDFCQNLTKLRYLDLQGYFERPDVSAGTKPGGNIIPDIDALANKADLVYLNLAGNLIKKIDPLKESVNLEYLNLSNNLLGDTVASYDWSKHTKLKQLRLDFNDINVLPGVPKSFPDCLMRLDLHANNITDIYKLAHLNNLVELNLYQNQLTSIIGISSMAKLKYIFLGKNESLSSISPLMDLAQSPGNELERVNLFNTSSAISGSTGITELRSEGINVYTNSPTTKASPDPQNSFLRLYFSYDEPDLRYTSSQIFSGSAKRSKEIGEKDEVIEITDADGNIFTAPIRIPRDLFIDDKDDTSGEPIGSHKILNKVDFFVDVPYAASIKSISYTDKTGQIHRVQNERELDAKEKISADVTPGEPIPISCTKILDTGPDSENIVVICMNDGYAVVDKNGNSVNELGDIEYAISDIIPGQYYGDPQPWSQAAAYTFHRIFDKQPFEEYKTYFNVYRLDLISDEHGVTHWANYSFPSTALGIGRTNNSGASLQTEKAIAVAKHTKLPYNKFVTITSEKSGGGAVEESMNISGDLNGRDIVSLHEFGHLIGNIGDEYIYAKEKTPIEYSSFEQANVLIQEENNMPEFPDFEKIPWKHWIVGRKDKPECENTTWDFRTMTWTNSCEPDVRDIQDNTRTITPVPTWLQISTYPDINKYQQANTQEDMAKWSAVGMYKGGKYRAWGFRPQPRCIMDARGPVNQYYCFPCREDLVLSILQMTTTVRHFSPDNRKSLVFTPGTPILFSVTPFIRPNTNQVVKWSIIPGLDSGDTIQNIPIKEDTCSWTAPDAAYEFDCTKLTANIQNKKEYIICAEITDSGPYDTIYNNKFIHDDLSADRRKPATRIVYWHIKDIETNKHDADYNADNKISEVEMEKVKGYFLNDTYYRIFGTEDGFSINPGWQIVLHDADYKEPFWNIEIKEILRVIEIKNAKGYEQNPKKKQEDGFNVILEKDYNEQALNLLPANVENYGNDKYITITVEKKSPISNHSVLALGFNVFINNPECKYVDLDMPLMSNSIWDSPDIVRTYTEGRGKYYIWSDTPFFYPTSNRFAIRFHFNVSGSKRTNVIIECYYRDGYGQKYIKLPDVQL